MKYIRVDSFQHFAFFILSWAMELFHIYNTQYTMFTSSPSADFKVDKVGGLRLTWSHYKDASTQNRTVRPWHFLSDPYLVNLINISVKFCGCGYHIFDAQLHMHVDIAVKFHGCRSNTFWNMHNKLFDTRMSVSKSICPPPHTHIWGMERRIIVAILQFSYSHPCWYILKYI